MQDQSKKNLDIARYIDQTLLKAEATESQIRQLCEQAIQNHFFGVCVNSSYVGLISDLLKGTDVSAVSVIGFPLGTMETKSKAFEAAECVRLGAKEIDMVISVGRLKEKNYEYVKKDIEAVVKASAGAIVKVILETSLLTNEEKEMGCKLSVEAGAHFVKTSTGFGGGGATVEDIRFMRKTVGPKIGVKASGGVKTLEQALALIEAGATRLGTSSGVELVSGKQITGGY